MAGSCGNSIFNLSRTSQAGFHSDCTVFTFPPVTCQSSYLCTSSPILLVILPFFFFNRSHPGGYKVETHVVLTLFSS